MTKKCSKCKQELSIEKFNKKGLDKNGIQKYQDFCRDCNKIASKEWYKKQGNKEKIIEKVKGYKNQKRDWFNDYKKSLSCSICGESHISCLDFHHTDPKVKESGLSGLWRYSTKEKVLDEIKKCIVLCANCHRKHHWNEHN